VRVEDLDSSRVREGMEKAQLADMWALGLDWDGPVVRQSERLALYEEAIAGLDDEGLLYPCYCTRAEIRASVSAPHSIPAADRYSGTCRELTARERAEKEASGRPPALRVRAENILVRRNDGVPAYQLAVVVDDAMQDIDEVVRGADLLDSTPRQIYLHRVLGLPSPGYAHVPLVLGPDGRRLAKRHGAVTLADREALGEDPREVLAWMARSLGLAAAGESPAPADLLARFDPARLPLDPTVWSPAE
jgi:glutamyl-tRNA synthetase